MDTSAVSLSTCMELHTHYRLEGSVGGGRGAWLLDSPCEPECAIWCLLHP